MKKQHKVECVQHLWHDKKNRGRTCVPSAHNQSLGIDWKHSKSERHRKEITEIRHIADKKKCSVSQMNWQEDSSLEFRHSWEKQIGSALPIQALGIKAVGQVYISPSGCTWSYMCGLQLEEDGGCGDVVSLRNVPGFCLSRMQWWNTAFVVEPLSGQLLVTEESMACCVGVMGTQSLSITNSSESL
ncbi:uncharacterized protein EI90DRAFT_3017539 [Cantharellus anzutake]|uniref:uncharacterized protein n=1 Tax=Cantharellus anzutake TaxID=1750568 RepID=UPI001907D763|nr:uncharacterized protein EI90DRAFT_3017539 [Cantharellus anzutake]KAF8328674.1 hypothetical protein EI90DRAFT_3017539 [Cantharellus anzutake]